MGMDPRDKQEQGQGGPGQIETIGSLTKERDRLCSEFATVKNHLEHMLTTDGKSDRTADLQTRADLLEEQIRKVSERLHVLEDAQEDAHLAAKRNAGQHETGQEWGSSRVERARVSLDAPGRSQTPLDALLDIVEKNVPGRAGAIEADAIREIKQYMEEMDERCREMDSELQDLKAQLAHAGERKSQRAVKGLEENVGRMKEHCTGFRKNIFQRAAGIVRDFAARGKIALNGIVQKLGIKGALKAAHAYHMASAEKMQDVLKRFDMISGEVQASRNSMANIGALASGIPDGKAKNGYQKLASRAAKEIDKSLRLERLRAPYEKNLARYQKLADRTAEKLAKLERLEQEAARARSTLGRLSDLKKGVASRDEGMPERHENTKKGPALAL